MEAWRARLAAAQQQFLEDDEDDEVNIQQALYHHVEEWVVHNVGRLQILIGIGERWMKGCLEIIFLLHLPLV
jgi:hypothetical protein